MAFNSRFFTQRLKHSSPAEFLYRIRQLFEVYLLRVQVHLNCRNLDPPEINKTQIIKLRMPNLVPEDHRQLTDLLDAKDPGQPPISLYADRVSADDIRMRWEPARLQQATLLMVLASEAETPVDSALAKKAAKTIVLDWIQDNPFMCGEHYKSAMECALRIPVFFYALKRLDFLKFSEYDSVLRMIYHHAVLISKKQSLFSSRGNHTVAEAVGLVFAGAVYRKTRRGRQWLKIGIGLLDDELPRQVLNDGGPAEQSIGYHRFVLDLYWLARDFIHKNDLGEVAEWKPWLTRGESFLNAFRDGGGELPAIGDSDNGFAVAKGIKPLRAANGSLQKKKWMIYNNSGYSTINDGQLTFIFDHGPLGMPPFYNHGHADALAVWLSYRGKPFIVDSGTYRYNGVPTWRRYFKGTRAHNTVTIDETDQALQETSFIWSQPNHGRLDAFIENDQLLFWSASHDGYTRLQDPVRHHRSILFDGGKHLLIRDFFKGVGTHQFQINFHLHPDVIIVPYGKCLRLENDGIYLYLRMLEGEFDIEKGSQGSHFGWFSPQYGKKEPTTALTFSKAGRPADVVLTTLIFFKLPY